MKKLVSKIQSMSPKEILIYVVIILLLLWLLKKGSKFIKAAFSKFRYDVFGAIPQDGSNPGVLTEARKPILDVLAATLYDDVRKIWGTAENTLGQINALNDTEFIYVFESYIKQFSANPYYDVDWELMPETEEDDKFLARSKKLGLPQA